MATDFVPAQQGDIAVPGGILRYRLSGLSTSTRTIVLENGWSGSFPYMHWIEQALAPHVRVLAYDRAGIGYSQSMAPLTAAAMTQQLSALLSTLHIDTPVTVLGHSYGGLIGVLHSVQEPALVSSIIQVDPTPEFDDAIIDPSFKIVPFAARFMQLCALLKINGPLYSMLAKQLPADVIDQLKPSTRWRLQSLNGSIEEIHLLYDIRRIISASKTGDHCPRLVISAAPATRRPSSWLGRLMSPERKEQQFKQASHALHQRQAELNRHSRWMTMPYDHVGLIANRESATAIAASVLDFLSKA